MLWPGHGGMQCAAAQQGAWGLIGYLDWDTMIPSRDSEKLACQCPKPQLLPMGFSLRTVG